MSVASKDPYTDHLYILAFPRLYNSIPHFIETDANLAKKCFRKFGKQIYGSKFAIIGLTYKEEINYCHESHPIEELSNPDVENWAYELPLPSIGTKCRVFTPPRAKFAVFMEVCHNSLFYRISAKTLK